jgi:hypothetical protein
MSDTSFYPVRIYLREMGSAPLLTREGEVVIAKRIERGQLVVMKAITHSPIVIKEIITVGKVCAMVCAPSRKLFSSMMKSSGWPTTRPELPI